jgi:cytochrome c peroxidase
MKPSYRCLAQETTREAVDENRAYHRLMSPRETLCAIALGLVVAAGCDLRPINPPEGGGGEGHAPPAGGQTAGVGGFGGEGGSQPEPWAWQLPPGFPTPKVPLDNPMTVAKAELGRHLFYDKRLSANETQACASCHKQALAFTDGLAQAVGSTGEQHTRSAMALGNVAYSVSLTWANSLLRELEPQAVVPMFGTMPIELGMGGQERLLLERLHAEPIYLDLFAEAFPDESEPISVDNVARALSTFQRTLISGGSAFDRFAFGDDPNGLSEAAQRGLNLFNSGQLGCFRCHGGFNLQDSVTFQGDVFAELEFHNTGLYNIGGHGDYPPGGEGLYSITGLPEDMGRFRSPTLRNITKTAPYMHDGSSATLDDVLDHYAAGGRTITKGPYAGVGVDNPYKSNLIDPFTLSAQGRADMHALFESFTDDTFLTNAAYGDPWAERE